ncbi:MAG: M20/M25/M40 family metallo-hydrolase [Planctomycetota bacterium]
MLVLFILEQLNKMEGVSYYTDKHKNIYVTKGSTYGYYPLLCAHTDTVHSIKGAIEIHENDGILIGKTPKGRATGCGGDDKAGVFVCLEMLERMSVVKVAFFVSEEIGCQGSAAADPTFFDNVAYGIEWDSPNDDIMSFSSSGFDLFDVDGDFIKTATPLLENAGVVKWQHHPYTDVSVIRKRFNVECLNLPPGYFHMHSANEYVVLEAVENAISLGMNLVGKLPIQQYLYDSKLPKKTPKREITGLVLGYH